PMSFRCLQARTGTLVSGSVALQFFDRTRYETNLDVFVYPYHRREVGEWLLSQGFRFVSAVGQDLYFNVAVLPYRAPRSSLHSGICAIYTFRRLLRGAQVNVQVIVARLAPIEAVLRSHSTCVMNVMSYEFAYCLFPRATLEERCTLLNRSSHDGERRIEGMQKYRGRGFRVIESLGWDEFLADSPFSFALRWVGDSHSWTIPL
ncbi:hypothetical protein GY45DRAFT_1212045, partial [Cubamyces sp. BRFM 1775]